jgi:hypothetical protein
VTELLEERRDKAAGKARVASGSYDNSSVVMKENEMEALGEAALAEFAAMNGISIGGANNQEAQPEGVPERNLGPMQRN